MTEELQKLTKALEIFLQSSEILTNDDETPDAAYVALSGIGGVFATLLNISITLEEIKTTMQLTQFAGKKGVMN